MTCCWERSSNCSKRFRLTRLSSQLKPRWLMGTHRGARKMNLFYYRGCVNHNFHQCSKRFIFRGFLLRFWPFILSNDFSRMVLQNFTTLCRVFRIIQASFKIRDTFTLLWPVLQLASAVTVSSLLTVRVSNEIELVGWDFFIKRIFHPHTT